MQTRTRERQKAFLKAFSNHGHRTLAAAEAGISLRSHELWLKKYPGYARRFQREHGAKLERMEAEADRRGLEGWDEPVYQGGELVGVKRRYSDDLLKFRLRALAPEKYCHGEGANVNVVQQVAVTGEPCDLDSFLESVDATAERVGGHVEGYVNGHGQVNGSGD